MLSYILGIIFIKRCLTHNLSLFSLSQESKNCWECNFWPENTPDSLQKCLLELSGADDYAQAQLYNCWFYSSDAIFYDEGSQLWAFITQAFLYKNAKFLCSLDWKFPEFFKTHPTFICSSFLSASRSLRTQTSVFSGTPCT